MFNNSLQYRNRNRNRNRIINSYLNNISNNNRHITPTDI